MSFFPATDDIQWETRDQIPTISYTKPVYLGAVGATPVHPTITLTLGNQYIFESFVSSQLFFESSQLLCFVVEEVAKK